MISSITKVLKEDEEEEENVEDASNNLSSDIVEES